MRYTVDKNIWQKKVYLESEVYHMKTRKLRLLSALLALAMLLTLLPTAAFAEDNHNCGATSEDNVTWSLDSDGTLTISGTGKMKDYGIHFNLVPWDSMKKQITKVVIGSKVTSIGIRAFQECTNLKNVTFPSSIETIEKWAFYGCVALESVDLSHLNDLKQIGNLAFNNCAALKTVKLPQNGNLNTIGANAFSFTNGQPAPQITEITIPASVTTIGEGAFEGCSKLKKVTFAPDSKLETIRNNAFKDCHKDLIICYSDERGKQALTSAGVSDDKIKPANPTVTFDFDNGTKAENKQVENGNVVDKPAPDPTKKDYIFAGWYTKDAVGNWAAEPFDFNTAIMDNMTLYAKWTPGGTCGVGGKLTWTLDGGTLTISGSGAMAEYSRPDDQPWANQRSSINKVVIGGGVTSIGKHAFTNCSQLSTVELPQNGALETINEIAFGRIDSSSEVGAGITEITIPESVKTIEMYAFNGCTKLATVTFAPNSQLETIHSDAFRDTAISEISIPASVKTINWDVFKGCSNLTKVIFESPSKLNYVDENAFRGCDNLQTVYYDGNNDGVKQSLQRQLGEKFKNGWTVKFETEGGSEVAQQNVKNGQTATKPTDPTKEGYKFGGWYDGDAKFDFDTPITKDTTLTAQWQLPEAPVTYKLTVTDGTAWVNGEQVTEAAKGDIVTIEASETALDGMVFERWEVRKGEVKLEDDRAAKTSFTMPAGEVQLEAMYQAADVHDSGWDAATVVTGAVIGTGTAILAYHIGMEVYAEQVLGKDVAVPRTRSEVALLAWQLAGSPAVNGEGEPLSEAAQAERWALESGLMEPDAEGNFNGTKKMSKWNALRTLDAAKKMG